MVVLCKGRDFIHQVQPRRWKVDANSRQDAVLMLSSVNLPGGVQVCRASPADGHAALSSYSTSVAN